MGRYPSGNSVPVGSFREISEELFRESTAQTASQIPPPGVTFWPEVCYLCHYWPVH